MTYLPLIGSDITVAYKFRVSISTIVVMYVCRSSFILPKVTLEILLHVDLKFFYFALQVSCPHAESSESSSTCGDPESDLTFNNAYTGSTPTAEVRNLAPATTYAFR